MFQPLNAKVEPPNYNFSVDTLSDFYPGKSPAELEKKYGKPQEMNDIQGTLTKKFYVAQIRYKFPVMIQVKDNNILDMFARLPTYFLHDIFFQSLVTRLGKQTTYKKVGEEAVYTWVQGNLLHIYSAACTITCFPIFYAVSDTKSPTASISEQMRKANQGQVKP
jgi:hypothetical protein